MKNEFADFIQVYTFPDQVLHALDEFVGNSAGMMATSSGGSSTLASSIHAKMQKAVADTVKFHEISGVSKERQTQENEVLDQLAWDIEKNIRSESFIDARADFTSREVANYFIDKQYKPLLARAKMFAQNFDQLNFSSFQKANVPDI